MKYFHKGTVCWDIPYQKMKVTTHQGLDIPFKLGIPGEKIKLNIKKIGKRKYQIEQFKIAYYSKNRTEVHCPHFTDCSGCQWLHVDYPTTLEWKQHYIAGLLNTYSIPWTGEIPIHHMKSPFATRFKATYPIQLDNGEIKIGLYKENSHEVLPLENCLMVPIEFNIIRNLLKSWIQDNNISIYDETTQEGWLRYLLLQKGFSSGKILVTLIVTEHNIDWMTGFVKFIEKQRLYKKVSGINEMINPLKGNTIITQQIYPIAGNSFLTETISGRQITIGSATFFQANPKLALEMFEELEMPETETLIEFFAGTGIIGMLHADKFLNGIGFESNPAAVKAGNQMLVFNKIKHYHLEQLDLYEANSDKFQEILSEYRIPPEKSVIIADPPRRGLGSSLIRFLTSHSAKRLIYVSCNPKNFAREAKELISAGYKLTNLKGYDLFPFTPHLEVVGIFAPVK